MLYIDITAVVEIDIVHYVDDENTSFFFSFFVFVVVGTRSASLFIFLFLVFVVDDVCPGLLQFLVVYAQLLPYLE